MYNFFTKSVALLGIVALAMTACKKDETQVTVQPGTAPTLSTMTKTLVLTQADADKPAITYSWSPYTYSVSGGAKIVSPVTYSLQIAKAGTNFANAQEISAGTDQTSTLTVKNTDLNQALQNLKLPSGVPNQVEVRLKTFVGGNQPVLYSAPTTLTVTSYTFCAQPDAKSAWAIIGPAGISWNDDVAMTYDCATQTYTYTGPLKADSFKFRYGGKWDANLGGTSATGGDLTQDGPDMKIPAAGTYTIVLKPGTIDPTTKKASGGSYTIK